MKHLSKRLLLLAAAGLLLVPLTQLSGEAPPATGPQTEKRFPSLTVPAGFQATLFACDPLIEYPSAIALGPRPNTLFVAADYMTGLGSDIVRRDEVRLVEDTDGDGYADRAPVYAGGFNSIMGLEYHQGTVYVMHAPFLTALRDTDGDGKADERKDLASGLGLTPEDNPVRLHCANGVVMGHDGWLYLALGDHGCNVPRAGTPPLVLNGGGILRCRPDGSRMHVFATGLRNIYDVALDEDLNVFVRDNENDGGTYKIRVCHSFFGADHGYPYLYYEHPDEAMPPLADLGLGSSAGGACYLEPRFPAEYRGNLFFCEWGRSVVRCRPEREGSGFARLKEIEFAAGADNDPYGFKPTDLIVDRDGSLLVADWADGQRPKRGRARIYRIAPTEKTKPLPPALPADAPVADLIARLDADSYYHRIDAQATLEKRGREAADALRAAIGKRTSGERGRMHAVWALVKLGASTAELLAIARTDPEPRVRVQALRALADSSPEKPATLAVEIAGLGFDIDLRVVREAIVAVGRLGWTGTPQWLSSVPIKADSALEHAAMQALRQCGNWPAVLQNLSLPDRELLRAVALRALADQADPAVVAGLIERLRSEPGAARRSAYAQHLARVYKKPADWVYWGYRPPPRPAHTVAWEQTDAIAKALNQLLVDPDATVRPAILRAMQREKVPVQTARLCQWLGEERLAASVTVILDSLRDAPAAEVRKDLAAVVRDKGHSAVNRTAALAILAKGLDDATRGQLLDLGAALEDGPVLAELLRQAGRLPAETARGLLLKKMTSPDATVRAAAIDTLATLAVGELGETLPRLLNDADPGVRRAAAVAAGTLKARAAVEGLLQHARDPVPEVRNACLEALRQLREPQVVPLAVKALDDRSTSLKALQCIADLGGPDQAGPIADLARSDPSPENLLGAVRALTEWSGRKDLPIMDQRALDRTAATLQGDSGVLVRWEVTGPLPAEEAGPFAELTRKLPAGPFSRIGLTAGWQTMFGGGADLRLPLTRGPNGKAAWVGFSDLVVTEDTPVQFLGSSTGPWTVWLNGRQVYQRKQDAAFQPDADRFEATLASGPNRVLVQLDGPQKSPVEFHLRFRRKSATAEHERLIEAALNRRGNPERGREVLRNMEKSLCLKCHRLGDQGEKIGPELTGIGSRFPRVYLVESILEPNRAIAPSFETLALELKTGRILSGVKIAETELTLTVADNEGKKHELAKSAIEVQQKQNKSTMPEGLEKKLTVEEFVDLIAFLVSQKENRGN